jgi:hypothetical protein
MPPEDLRRKLDVLRGYCEQEGRDYGAIEKTVLVQLGPATSRSTNELLDELGRLAELGFDTAIASLVDVETPLQSIEAVGRDVIPKMRSLGPAQSASTVSRTPGY